MRSSFQVAVVAMLLSAAASQAGVAREAERVHRHVLPHSETGKASIYASRFQGRRMSDGQRFNTGSNAAASKTLPLGTKAEVTDLKTRKSADVVIKDRGPVPRGRVIDLTPHTARKIGLTAKQGLAPVKVVPISIPRADKATGR